MKFRIKRFAALMMAVMMMLGAVSAFAQELQPGMRAKALADGKNISTEMQIEIDQATLSSLLGMFGLTSGAGDAAQQSAAAGQQAVIDTLLGALNKLKMTSLQSSTDAYITVGTDKGDLMDINANMDVQSGKAFVTTSVMPNLKFTLPKDMLGSFTSVPQTHTMQMIQQWLAPYSKLFEEFSNKQQAEKGKIETGSFEVIDQGSFDKKISIDVDTHMVAALVEEFLPLIKVDKIIQDHLALTATSELAQANDMGDSAKKFQDFIAELEKSIAEMKAKSNAVVAKLDQYSDSKTENMFLQAELIENEVPFALLSVSVLPGAEGQDMHLSLLLNQADQTTAADPAALAVQMVDWAALRGEVLAGTNTQALLLEVAAAEKKSAADNKQLANVKVTMYTTGLNLGFVMDGSTSLSGKYESESSFSFNFLSPQPLITIHTKESETDKALPSATFEGYKEVVLSQTMSEEDTQLLGEQLMAALPVLLEKLKVALPEEAPMLTLFLSGAMADQTTVTPTPVTP